MNALLTEPIIFHNDLPIPALAYGVIALVTFVALALITWSYRDVANRHSHKTSEQQAHH
jgi:protein-S-isoprenylcysteine O-methyltransferase Ste14